MKRAVRLKRDYPYPPEEVWLALTDRALLAAWLMPNDFEPRVGHRFTMTTDPAPGFDGIVQLEVLALDAPRRMVWRWRGGPVDTTLTFRLEPRRVGRGLGTRLHLDHEGFEGAQALLVSLILGAGWSRMLRRRLHAVLAGRAAPCASPEPGAWSVIAQLLRPLLERLQR